MMLALDHVQIAIPADSEVTARDFYGRILGLSEHDKPIELFGRGGCWFDLGLHQLHLGVDPDFRPAKKAHIALTTDALDTLRVRIENAGFPVHGDVPINGRHRFFTEDPFGNRLEILQMDFIG
jgi:catechol 2,3-dioxygenase-like lactoylglutathione lyase family enzyme